MSRVPLSGNDPKTPNGSTPTDEKYPSGQYKDYWVLSEYERNQGWVRPLRTAYVHQACGTQTRMGLTLSETYARDPKFYSHTFCVMCKDHFPVDQFYWANTSEKVGS